LFDNILQPHWATSTTFSVENLAGIVTEVDYISYDEAYPIVKNVWERYLTQGLIHKY